MEDNILIKKINSTDMREVALIHTASFKKSLLTNLGIDIVQKYYEWQLKSPDRVYPYGAFFNKTLVGYCFGGSFSMALGGFLLRNKKVIFYSLLKRPWILANPKFLYKIITGLKVFTRFLKMKKIENISFLNKKRQHYGILAIATSPDFRGRGIGASLMTFSEKIAKKKSFEMIRLSVSPKNENAINFYLHLGYSKIISSKNNSWDGTMEKKFRSFIV